MKSLCLWGSALSLSAALALGMAPSANAQDVIIGLNPDAENLFGAMSDMMPGQSVSDTFTVKNLGTTTCSFYLQAESAVEADFARAEDMESCEKMLEALEMTVAVRTDEETMVYSGLANQIDCDDDHVEMIGRRILLDELAPGETVDILATVTVPEWVDNAHAGAEGKFWWHFTAEGPGIPTATPPPAPDEAAAEAETARTPWQRILPRTGDPTALWFWLLLLVAASLFVAGLLRAKKRGGRPGAG